jgi:iron-sulfur cluster assembly protein
MKLRVGVKGGGCSGFNYTLDLTEVQKDSDEAWTFTYARTPRVSAAALGESGSDSSGGTATATATDDNFSVTIVCDPKSYLYLNGTVIDYKDEIMGSGFVFNNPNSTSTCGCGSSFSA